MTLSLALYQKLYLVRWATEAIRKEYPNDQIKTPVHLSLGEEAIAVGVCHAIGKNGLFYGTYRNHGLYLSLTLETDKFFAELYGKRTGASGGKAGSMHLTAPESGLMGTSAVVGTTIPMAVGAAFANRVRRTDKAIVVFFGDGALDEGVFWESFNTACVLKLPMIFICEDNGLAPHTLKVDRQGYPAIHKVLERFNCLTFRNETTDVEEIHSLALKAGLLAREQQLPVFLHLHYYRYLEHVGVNEDFDQGYRTRDEFEKWYKVDPINLQRKRLVEMNLEKEVSDVENQVREQVDRSIALAKAAPFPDKADLFKGVWS
ncbi:thiamine pyrophosphate-dependent dehydrogenase E1 component subunit alpha [bacterium]|nr:thiamine pyrophosphate-dependent dehydrogenase E1 component subunit alpha [bacterium]